MNNAKPGINLTSTAKKSSGSDEVTRRLLYSAIALTLFAVLYADIQTPLGVAVWVFYIVPVTISLWLKHPIVPICVAVFITLLIISSFYVDEPDMETFVTQSNRTMGAFAVWVVAAIGYFFIRNRNFVQSEEWLQSGETRLSVLMLGEQVIADLGTNVLGFLTDYLGAVAGAFFVQDDEGFLCVATHGVSGDGVPTRFAHGEGLLGQVAKDQGIVTMNDIPEQYLTTSCAFGRGKPRHVMIFAINDDNLANAVIELGFAHQPDEATMAFAARISESIGAAVRSSKYRLHLQKLLEETQVQSEELQVQSAELRVSNEELEEQSRVLQESQARLEQQQTELEQTNVQLEEQTQQLELQRDDLQKAQDTLERRSDELQQASQYKSDFLANMSHELRTPLNSSLILSKLLADNPDGNLTAEQILHAQTIQSAGNDLLDLINDILDLSKIEAGHMEIMPESIRVSTIVDSINRTFKPVAEQKMLRFSCDISPACPREIQTDGKRLEQVLKNLLSNAIKFTKQGEVKLTISRTADERIAFAVSDTGIGISAEHHLIIFEAFRQADGTTNRKFGG
ncbi:MAG: histidine kinase dimerization/phospho-acceptor domain-containing protein, partial [Pseudomonadota bacterium]